MAGWPGRSPALTNVELALSPLFVLADPLDRHDMLVIGGVEDDDALGGAPGLADVMDRAADELAAIGHQHDLILFVDREGGDQRPVAVIHRHRHDAFAAAIGDAVLVARGAL